MSSIMTDSRKTANRLFNPQLSLREFYRKLVANRSSFYFGLVDKLLTIAVWEKWRALWIFEHGREKVTNSIIGHFPRNLLGGLSWCNYCEKGPVLDSSQHLLLASLVCYPFASTVLKLSSLGISYSPFSCFFWLIKASYL